MKALPARLRYTADAFALKKKEGLRAMEDRELLDALRAHPEEGLWALTQKYGALISAVVRRILPGDPQDAEECAADVLVRIWRDSRSITLQNGTMRGFVIWAARNAAIDRYRALKRQRQRTVDAEDEQLTLIAAPHSIAAEAETTEAMARVERAIRELPPPDDEIFARRFLLCETVPQIAERLKMNIKAVESRLQRGKKKLREQLVREGVTPE